MQQYCELPTPKGILRGFFHHPNIDQFPVCIIFHGFTGNKTGTKFSYVQLARMLEAKGIATLRMDFLGSGDSDLNFIDMTFDDEVSCARVMLEEMLQMPQITKVYLLGHSMGGAVASELVKLYPSEIQKLCLWAPAFNLPDAVAYIKGNVPESDSYDHNGFEISNDFVKDITSRDLYQDLDKYQNELMVIHGTADMTVPFAISKKYLACFKKDTLFYPIPDGSHNFDKLSDIKQVMKLSLDFLSE